MFTIDSLHRRVRRIDDLCRGLAKETHVPKAEEDDPLLRRLTRERRTSTNKR